MSVRHIDYLKLSSSKFLPVEIRPIRCLVDMPSGTVRTAKWMTHDHWKELRMLICDIADEYEDEKQLNRVTQDVKCNEHKLKNGLLLKIGYMFVPYSSCRCNFLVPRQDVTWTDDEDDDDDDTQELKDKGGRYSSITPSGEMLVVSVRLQDQIALSSSSRRPAIPASPATADKLLVKALDRSFVVTNTISDYFSSSPKDVASSSSTENSEFGKLLSLKNIVGKSCKRDHKRAEKCENSENKRPRRRQVKSENNAPEKSFVESDSVPLNDRYIHDNLSFLQEKETNKCYGENLMAANRLIHTDIYQGYFEVKHEDSDISISEEQLESDDVYFDAHTQDFSYNPSNTQERYASQVHMMEDSDGSNHNYEREIHSGFNTHSTSYTDSLPLVNDTFISRLREEPENFINSHNENSIERHDTLSFVKNENEHDSFSSYSKGYVTVSNPQQYYGSSSSSVMSYQVECDNSSIESEEEVKRLFKSRVNHVSSSSSQVTTHNVYAGEDSEDPRDMCKGLNKKEEMQLQETSESLNESFRVKIPREFLEHRSLERSSPSKNRGIPNHSKVLELFGENEDSNDLLAREVKRRPIWGNCDSQEEEYIPQPLVNDSDSLTTCSDYSPSSINFFGCRRSKRILSRDQNVLDQKNTVSTDNKRVVSKRTNKEKRGKNNAKTPEKLKSSNKLINKVNKNKSDIKLFEKNHSMASGMNEVDYSSKCEHEYKPESRAEKVKTKCKEKKNLKECDNKTKNYQSFCNDSQISNDFDLDNDPEFRSEKWKKMSQNTKGRKKPYCEKKIEFEKLSDIKCQARASNIKKHNCLSYESSVSNSKNIKQARKITKDMKKDAEIGRKLLKGKDPYSSSSTGGRMTKNSSQRKKITRKGKKYVVPSNQPTLTDCLFSKSFSGTSSRCKPRPIEEESFFADSALTDDYNELSDKENPHTTRISLSDQLCSEEKDERFLEMDEESALDDLPDFSQLCRRVTSPNLQEKESVEEEKNYQLNEEHTEKVDWGAIGVMEKSNKVSEATINQCCNKICNMSEKELFNRLEESSDFFHGIIEGRLPNTLHDMFARNSCRDMRSADVFFPYSEDQIEFTVCFLRDNYSAKLAQVKCHDINNYIWRVLSPSFFIKIVMDMENVDEDTSILLLRQMPEPK